MKNCQIPNDFEKLTAADLDDRFFFQELMASFASLTGADAVWVWRLLDEEFREHCRAVTGPTTESNELPLESEQLKLLLDISSNAENSKSTILPHVLHSSGVKILTLAKLFRSHTRFVVGLVWNNDQVTPENLDIIQNAYDILQSISQSPSDEIDPSMNDTSTKDSSRIDTSRNEPGTHPTWGTQFDFKGFRSAMDSAMEHRNSSDDPMEARQPISLLRLSEFVHCIHGSLDGNETAHVVVDETRSLLNCDRVSVVLRKRGRMRLVAISGQHSVNFRSDVVLALQKLSRVVLKTRDSFWYPDESKARSTPVNRALDQYLGKSSAKTIVIFPIHEPTSKPNESGEYPTPPRLLGGFVIENFDQVWNRETNQPQIEMALQHAGDAIRNSSRHRRLFLYPLWRVIGNLRIVATARNITISTLVLLGILGAAATLYYVPADLNVRAEGQLIPAVRRKVFAEIDGQVNSVRVGHGEQVKSGQILAKLTSEELQVRLAEVNGRIESTQARLDVLKLSGLTRNNEDQSSPASQQGNANSLRAELASLKEQLSILTRMSQRLTINAPIDGQVLTWDPEQVLLNRPVRTGEELFEIAEKDGAWQLELLIPDHRAGRVIKAFHAANQPLVVSFVLASQPGRRFEGKLQELSQSTELGPDQKQLVRAIVVFERELVALDARQARAGVVTKINCGKTSLGYAWLCDVFDFVESEILFRIW